MPIASNVSGSPVCWSLRQASSNQASVVAIQHGLDLVHQLALRSLVDPLVDPDGLSLGRDGDHAPQTTLVCFDDRSQALMSPAST